MCQVEGYCKEFTPPVYFCLNADQAFDYTRWKPPIHWKGTVGGKKVTFTQVNSWAYGLEDFNWEGFPSDLEKLKKCIIKAIDDAMRVMD